MSEMLKVVVPFSRWLRGEGPTKSRLERAADGKRCCLGEAMVAAGVAPAHIQDVTSPFRLLATTGENPIPALVFKNRNGEYDSNNAICQDMMGINDDTLINDEERTAKLTHLGKQAGIEFDFRPNE